MLTLSLPTQYALWLEGGPFIFWLSVGLCAQCLYDIGLRGPAVAINLAIILSLQVSPAWHLVCGLRNAIFGHCCMTFVAYVLFGTPIGHWFSTVT